MDQSLSGDYKITYYESDFPTNLNQILAEIYHSPYSLLDTIHPLINPSAVVIEEDKNFNKPLHIIVFQQIGQEIKVFNELVSIEDKFIEIFSDFIFAKFPKTKVISFNKMIRKPKNLKCPAYIKAYSQDFVVTLPRTSEEYLAKMGTKTRKHLKYYMNRLNKQFSDYYFRIYIGREIDASLIGRIVEMNSARMKTKNIVPGIDKTYEDYLFRFSQLYGLVGTIYVGDKIIAGTICSKVENDYFLHVISHDPDYDKYNVGQVALFQTIDACMNEGGKFFHFLWGDNPYKQHFLGDRHELYSVFIFKHSFDKWFSFGVDKIKLLARRVGNWCLKH